MQPRVVSIRKFHRISDPLISSDFSIIADYTARKSRHLYDVDRLFENIPSYSDRWHEYLSLRRWGIISRDNNKEGREGAVVCIEQDGSILNANDFMFPRGVRGHPI